MSTSKDIGQLFVRARDKKGLKIEDVSVKSQIPSKILKEIEEGMLDRLDPIYMKSFLKKYATFLEMDVEEVIRRYSMMPLKAPRQEFKPKANMPIITEKTKEKKQPKDEVSKALQKKNIQTAMMVALSCILVILTFVFLGMLRSRIVSGVPERDIRAEIENRSRRAKTKIEKPVLKQEAPKEKPAPPVVEPQKEEVKQETVLPAPAPVKTKPAAAEAKSSELVLTLRANDKAWVQLTEKEKTLFSGILESGKAKTWKSDGVVTVWTGKAEKLEFIVNGRDLGKIADGVVKNIKISSEGVRIGNKWVNRFD